MKFDWDRRKAQSNLRKHGVSFEEGSTAFEDEAAAVDYDFAHSVHEDRHVLIGNSRHGQTVVVAFTDRASTIRIISVRPAMLQERRQYERQARERGFRGEV